MTECTRAHTHVERQGISHQEETSGARRTVRGLMGGRADIGSCLLAVSTNILPHSGLLPTNPLKENPRCSLRDTLSTLLTPLFTW